jgi:hypothetical protein
LTRPLLGCVIVLATVTSPRSVFAQADVEAAKADARARLLKGSRYLDAGSNARALKEFEEAYRIFPSPKIFFNIGLANAQLGHYPEALRAFEHFLSEATDVAAETIAQARTQAELVRPKVAVIDVVCARAGVEVLVDERTVGRTPLGDPLYLSPGRHLFAARFEDGVAPFSKTLQGVGGTRDRVEVPVAIPTPTVASSEPVAPTVPSSPAPAHPPEVLVNRPSSTAPPGDRPLYQRPWVWAVAAGALAAAGTTLWLVAGRSSDYPDASLGRMNFPAGATP